jgi:hypothetical protein
MHYFQTAISSKASSIRVLTRTELSALDISSQ